MRAYLPLSHDELASFLNNGSKELESILAPTPFYVGENEDLDEEEINISYPLKQLRHQWRCALQIKRPELY